MADKEKTVQEVLDGLTDEQKKAVAIFTALAVQEELKKHGIEVTDDEQV